jgi:hypothetical protein
MRFLQRNLGVSRPWSVRSDNSMKAMVRLVPRPAVLAALAVMASLSAVTIASGQNSEQKAGDAAKGQPAADAAKADSAARRLGEIAEIERLLTGPAANPECVWLGRRVISLLWRDDLDTAFRHLDLYDRFGCPGAHIQSSFRCLVRQGDFDPKAAETLNARIQACWINPTAPAPTVPTAANPPDTGTTSR